MYFLYSTLTEKYFQSNCTTDITLERHSAEVVSLQIIIPIFIFTFMYTTISCILTTTMPEIL